MTIEEAVEAVVRAANQHTSASEDRALAEALGALSGYDGEELELIREKIADSLSEIEAPAGAGPVSIWLGAAVERGASPAQSGKQVVSTLTQLCQRLPLETDESDAPESADSYEVGDDLAGGLEMLGQSAIAHLSRDRELLNDLRSDEEANRILCAAEGLSPGAMWVLQALRQRNGEVIVLHGLEARGFRVGYQNISNCFHFFSLLQIALGAKMPGGRQPSAAIQSAAKGDSEAECHDQAWWHYGQPTASTAEISAMVFGEATLDSIQKVDDTQVILLWPPVLKGRGWSSGFFSPLLVAAPPDVRIIKELDAVEITEWRDRLGLAKTSTKPWWKFF